MSRKQRGLFHSSQFRVCRRRLSQAIPELLSKYASKKKKPIFSPPSPYLFFRNLSISPLSMSSLISLGLRPSTWQPTLNAVPRISLTDPFRSLEKDLNRIVRAISMMSSRGTLFECLIFFSFFLSRGGSFNALMMREDAVGTTETAACRFWIVSFTVTRRPFY
ncbi:uncharacterized protein F4817DRAFT_168813 [Daldinia loculata]|uniref:uncharacterized protein n=1 Tax=Daldinia loculata TaxID=103429 RepID=UPI0020C1D7FC|nr:uncharacterized protein F4817DRAFT_168813 [Daldinia loculata]KAI1645749.1 hypothetical protein F4817DRAFT_168813 [Daldinia loculata]